MSLRLSVLDQSPISEGSNAGDALRKSIDLAQWAEQEGYLRYWVAEHHGTPMLAGTSPEIVIGQIAAATSALRVGSGGVMLPHYSPLKVAEVFRLLSELFPNRIDLAVGRAAGTDPLTAFALRRDRRLGAADDFADQLHELLAFSRDGFPPGHQFSRLSLAGAATPDVWLLGSSPQSGIWAAQHGLPYAFADFINPTGGASAQHYRRAFVPSRTLAAPKVAVAVWALVAETRAEAQRLASSAQVAFIQFLSGRPIPVPSVKTALVALAEHPEALALFSHHRRAIVADPATARAEIEAVAAEYGADEVFVVTITFDHEDRKRSYALLAEAFRAPASRS